MNIWFLNCRVKYLDALTTAIPMIILVNMEVQPSCMSETYLGILRNEILRLPLADTGGGQIGSELKLSVSASVGSWSWALGCLGFHLFSANNLLIYKIY